MKSIELISDPSTTYDKSAQPLEWESDRLDYAHTIREIIRKPLNPAGADIVEIHKGIRVLSALEGLVTGDMLNLEDQDHEHLCDKVNAFRWAIVDIRIDRFLSAVLGAGSIRNGEQHAAP